MEEVKTQETYQILKKEFTDLCDSKFTMPWQYQSFIDIAKIDLPNIQDDGEAESVREMINQAKLKAWKLRVIGIFVSVAGTGAAVLGYFNFDKFSSVQSDLVDNTPVPTQTGDPTLEPSSIPTETPIPTATDEGIFTDLDEEPTETPAATGTPEAPAEATTSTSEQSNETPIVETTVSPTEEATTVIPTTTTESTVTAEAGDDPLGEFELMNGEEFETNNDYFFTSGETETNDAGYNLLAFNSDNQEFISAAQNSEDITELDNDGLVRIGQEVIVIGVLTFPDGENSGYVLVETNDGQKFFVSDRGLGDAQTGSGSGEVQEEQSDIELGQTFTAQGTIYEDTENQFSGNNYYFEFQLQEGQVIDVDSGHPDMDNIVHVGNGLYRVGTNNTDGFQYTGSDGKNTIAVNVGSYSGN